ncbi:MAG TPA: class I SAM-dependent methyltransferase [Gammaproteobacteria bacterium]|nr:class I SAM-dependent methyltransferase [Gammaproteobacteria bacterium]
MVMKFIEQLISNNGPETSDYPALNAAINKISARVKEYGDQDTAYQRLCQILAPVLTLETMQGFAYLKPHGYAGDFEIIDRIYTSWVSPKQTLVKWDHFFHQQQAPRAVKNRKEYFIKLLSELDSSISEPLRVLNIGSGPGRDLLDFLDSRPNFLGQIDCVELDPNAIEYASRLCTDHTDKIQFVNKNIFRYQPRDKYHLIWSAGLFDYFKDKQFVRLLQRLYPYLLPGGQLVVGNFSDRNPTQGYMELFGHWFLKHRSAEQLFKLAQNSGVHTSLIDVFNEPLGVNLFLHLQHQDRYTNAQA